MAGLATPDPFFNSDKINRLTDFNFSKFLKNTEIVLVMFYNPNDSESFFSSKHFSLAAFQTRRRRHAFAAVDCYRFGHLCYKNDVQDTPTFTLFSNGHKVATITDVDTFDSDTMKGFVEKAPVLSGPIKEKERKRYLPIEYR